MSVVHDIKNEDPVFLQEEIIRNELPDEMCNKVKLDVFSELPSTNSYLLERSDDDYKYPVFCIAEKQTAGRGRMGRKWHSPFAKNIYLSCRWDLPCEVGQLSGLSLVIGLAVVKALQEDSLGKKLQLKWPNDILYDNKKLGGILVEIVSESNGTCSVIIGIGLNVNMQDDEEQLTSPWTSLQQIATEGIDRNVLVAALIKEVVNTTNTFIKNGFAGFIKMWNRYDSLLNKEVTVTHFDKKITGKALGVNHLGQLRLQKADKTIVTCTSGDASFHQ